MLILQAKRYIVWTAYAALMLAVFLYYDDMQPSAFFAAVTLIMAFGVVLNARDGAAQDKALRGSASWAGDTKAADGVSGSRRRAEYDLLRALAACFVIVTHVFQTNMAVASEPHRDQQLLSLVTLCCNPIYVMLSGALLLRWKEESIWEFYRKRITKLLLPLLLYYTFYLWENRIITGMSFMEAAGLVLGNLISGSTPETPYYWLIYTIMSLYVVFPFFRYMLRDMPYRIAGTLSVLCICFMGAAAYLPLLLGGFGISTFLGSWAGAAILGYFLSLEETRRFDGMIMALGAGAAVCMAACVYLGCDYMQLCTGTAPVMIIFSAGLFSAVLHLGGLLRERHLLKVVGFLSRHSLGIILIHWWVVFWPVNRHFGLGIIELSGTRCLLLSAITLIISAAAAFGVDRLLILPIERLMGFVRKSFQKLHRNP